MTPTNPGLIMRTQGPPTIEQTNHDPGVDGGLARIPAPTGPPPPDPNRKRVMALQRFALSITVFTIVGHLFLGFEQSPLIPISTVLVGYALDSGLEWIEAKATGRPTRFGKTVGSVVTYLLPTHITALACAMLLYAGGVVWPYWLAVAVALTSKHIVKAPVGSGWRHTLNPSNTGIVVVLLMFPWVGIAPPYEFTENVQQPWDWLVPLGILTAGSLLNGKLTGRLPLIMAWVGGFVAQAAIRAVTTDHSFPAAVAPLSGVAFILFTNYMITDPGTSPFTRRGQVVFGLGCAGWYGLLLVVHVSFGLFFALVLTCVTRTLGLYLAKVRRPRREGLVAAQ